MKKFVISHRNAKSICPDGLIASIFMQCLAVLDSSQEYEFRSTMPSPTVKDGIFCSQDAKEIINSDEVGNISELMFLDCHPAQDSVKNQSIEIKDKSGVLYSIPISLYDHHLSSVAVNLQKREPSFSVAISGELNKISGSHISAKFFLDKLLKIIKDNGDLSDHQKNDSSKIEGGFDKTEAGKYINAFDNLRLLLPHKDLIKNAFKSLKTKVSKML